MPSQENRRNDPGETRITAGETMNIRSFRCPHCRLIAVIIAILVLASLILSPHAGAETAAGISAGPAKVCPDPGCTCMPEGQAESLGYIRCPVNETPCFRDSFGRPLYCYHAPSLMTCDSPGCNGSDRASGPSPGSIQLIITMETPGTVTGECGEAGSDACALPVSEQTPGGAPADPFGSILVFFRSLFGIQQA